ncbi:MAG: cell wall metabolism sensor histidine kinase WalK, partial [Lachnospiraceae bacterium]|nr:cell wall metabolism sensor histidine kinase WalK [Lachnospiraceae bacterium]
KDINRIFDRFYKADLTRNTQGSGLGLSIANEIMRGLKEKLWVESVEGEGSSFFFTVSYK